MTSATGSETETRARIFLIAKTVVVGWKSIAAELIRFPDPACALHGAAGFKLGASNLEHCSSKKDISTDVERPFFRLLPKVFGIDPHYVAPRDNT